MTAKLTDLNDHLFEQLARLSTAKGDDLTAEIERARAVAGVSAQIISVGRLAIDAQRTIGHTPGQPRAIRLLGLDET